MSIPAISSRIPQDLVNREGAGLCFSVMDHDMVTKNDFEGEAFLPLCNVTEAASLDDVRHTELCLMHPNEKSEYAGQSLFSRPKAKRPKMSTDGLSTVF